MPPPPIDLAKKLTLFSEHWSPRVAAEMETGFGKLQFKLAKLKGEFVWHAHAGTDEVFYVLAGELTIEFRDGEARLTPGQLLVVPRGVEHRPVARRECHVLLVEPRGVVNTGDAADSEADGGLTAEQDVWV